MSSNIHKFCSKIFLKIIEQNDQKMWKERQKPARVLKDALPHDDLRRHPALQMLQHTKVTVVASNHLYEDVGRDPFWQVSINNQIAREFVKHQLKS